MSVEIFRVLDEIFPLERVGMVHFLQEGPAETWTYLIAGFVVIFGVMGLYLISLIVRSRNLTQDLDTLQEIEKQAG